MQEAGCAKRNWCERTERTRAGRTGGFGKCLVRRYGGKDVCAELLFQAQTCADCKPPNCTNCICILAAGGGDKSHCNNGNNGYDYVCVREVLKRRTRRGS